MVVRAKGSRVKSAEIMTALGKQLARYKQPKRIFFVPELPRNASGKLLRRTLANDPLNR